MKQTNNIYLNRYALILLMAWIGNLLPIYAQEGVPFFQNHDTDEYNAHNRNFDVVCDSSGIVYFANFEGIIYYNGVNWNQILVPGWSRVTCLHIDKQNQIWAGGHNFIGKITASENGSPVLATLISDHENNKDNLRIGEVTHIEESSDSLLFYTTSEQIVVVRQHQLSSVQPFTDRVEKEREKTIVLSDDLIVTTDGTNGLLFMNKNHEKLSTLTEANGLCSNMISQIATDHKGSLWGATDNGVFRVMAPSFYTRFTEDQGLKGEVTSLIHHKQQFYVGTLHGLYLYDKDTFRFNVFRNIKQSCWQLKEGPSGILYAATSAGLYGIHKERVEVVYNDDAFSITSHPSDPQVLYAGGMEGIYQIREKEITKISDVRQAMKLEFFANHLWAETLYGEIYRIDPENQQSILQDSLCGLKSSAENKLYITRQGLQVSSRSGIHRWDEISQRFVVANSPLNPIIEAGEWCPGVTAVDPSGEQAWVTGGNGKDVAVLINGKIDSVRSQQLDIVNFYTIRTLFLEDENTGWMGGDFGLIKIDFSQPDQAYDLRPEVYIRSIYTGVDSLFFGGENSEVDQTQYSSIPTFNSQTRSFKFTFSSVASDMINATKYSYRLQGYEESWSPWETDHVKEYTNLSYGKYTFQVKTLDPFGRESDAKSFSFVILKPFYLKWYCLVVYAVLLLLTLIAFFKWRTRKLLQEKERLETIVEQRTLQIRKQRDEISEKSEKLETALTELNKAQALLIRQEKITTVGKLTRGLIDRILNPLNYLINFSHLSSTLLKDMKEDLEEEEDKISKEGYKDMQEILDMLNTNLDKIEQHGKSTSRILKAMEEMLSDHSCHLTDTDIDELVGGNLEVFKKEHQQEIQESSIQITFIPLNEPLMVKADPLQLGKALISMMQNGLQALRKKKRKTAFAAEMIIRLDKQGDQIQIHLYDNGIGIEQSIMDKIFDPFFTTKTTAEAAGVGLYLSREIIAGHEGSMEVKSVKNESTEFTLSLPIHQPLQSGQQPPSLS